MVVNGLHLSLYSLLWLNCTEFSTILQCNIAVSMFICIHFTIKIPALCSVMLSYRVVIAFGLQILPVVWMQCAPGVSLIWAFIITVKSLSIFSNRTLSLKQFFSVWGLIWWNNMVQYVREVWEISLPIIMCKLKFNPCLSLSTWS